MDVFSKITGEGGKGPIRTYIHKVFSWTEIQSAHQEMSDNKNRKVIYISTKDLLLTFIYDGIQWKNRCPGNLNRSVFAMSWAQSNHNYPWGELLAVRDRPSGLRLLSLLSCLFSVSYNLVFVERLLFFLTVDSHL